MTGPRPRALRSCRPPPHTHSSPLAKVLDKMKTIGDEVGGLKPDLHCLSAAIDAAGGVGDWESAVRLLDDLRAAGIKPDGFVYR